MQFYDAAAQQLIRRAFCHRTDHTDRLIDLLIDSGEFQWPNTTKEAELIDFYESGLDWIEDDTMELIEARGIDLGQVDFQRVATVAYRLAVCADEVLMEELKAGDETALERIASRHRDRLLRELSHDLDGESAAAVVGRVFDNIKQDAHKFRTGAAFRAWLYTTLNEELKPLGKDWLSVAGLDELRLLVTSDQLAAADALQDVGEQAEYLRSVV